MSQLLSSPSLSIISEIYPILGRYQQHVHHLEPGTEPQRFMEREASLQSGIPDDLRQFLLIHNGAVLFDGDLSIRSLSALSIADGNHREVVLFAQMNVMQNPVLMDGVVTEHWAYIIDLQGMGCYGLWENGRFTPLYRGFQDWLLSNIRLLEDGTFPSAFEKRRNLAQDSLLFEATRVSGLMDAGNYETASSILSEVLQELPTSKLWVQYADCLKTLGRPGWEQALLQSLDALHFPLSHADMLPPDVNWVANIVERVPVFQTAVEEIVARLWSEDISMLTDNLSTHDLECLESLAIVLCHAQTETPVSFVELMEQFNRWNPSYVPARLMLSHVDACVQRDDHDAAETILFTLMRRNDSFEAECLLRLARIVVMRHEPWGLHILFDLLHLKPSVSVETEAWLLAAQYCLDNEQFEKASEFLETVVSLWDVESTTSLSGWYWQIQGVLAHQEQRLGEAGPYFLKATRLTPSNDVVRLGNISVSEGELYQTLQQPNTSNQRYEQAMEYFASVDASLHMADALLHWGRLTGMQQHFQQAATLFQQAGFASGLSVADRYLSGKRTPWFWYLENTKELVQRWVQYRRSQGRSIRQEADNPERRLYGMKMAVADSPVDIVEVLSTQLYNSRTVIERDLVTQTHEQYAYFVAGVELMLAHPSSHAHSEMLSLIQSTQLDTVATDALVQSLSRTRNQSVIDSLASMLTVEHSVSAQWIATQVLGYRRETSCIQAILTLLDETEELRIQQSCLMALGRLGDSSIVPTLDAYGDIPNLMEHWATALLLLGDDIAIHQLAGQLSEGKLGEQSILGHLVGRYGGPTNLLLLKCLAESEQPVNLSAIHGLGYLGDARAIPILLEMTGLRDRNKAIAASHALELLTGHHENTEDYLLRARWQRWLDAQPTWRSNVRYRGGVPMSPASLIEGLGHDDRLVRASSYDELVIATGVQLPFDIDGSWRRQKAQIQAWQSWWQEQRSTYPVGCWVLHGQC